jgi:hypothetical protein
VLDPTQHQEPPSRASGLASIKPVGKIRNGSSRRSWLSSRAASAQDAVMANESFVVEVAEWLEKGAHDTDLVRIAGRIRERKPPFVRMRIITHLEAGEIKGIEYVVEHPVKDFQAAVGLTDEEMGLLREFVTTNADPCIKIGFQLCQELGETVCISQLNYVPQGATQQASAEILGLVSRIFSVSQLHKDFEIIESE